MNSAVLLLSVSLMGVEYEVEQINGEKVFVIQIERAIVDQLREGFTVSSTIPESHAEVRRVQITIVDNATEQRTTNSVPAPANNGVTLAPDESILPERHSNFTPAPATLTPQTIPLPTFRNTETESPTPFADTSPELPRELPAVPSPNISIPGDLALISKQPPVIILEENPESPILIRAEDGEPSKPPAPTSDTSAETTPAASLPVTGEPDLITAHEGQFVALASANSKLSDTTETAPTTDAPSPKPSSTLLLVCLFSVALNVFFALITLRHYRH